MKNELKEDINTKELNELDYMYTCPRCHGDGGVEWVHVGGFGNRRWIPCKLCNGSGFIDWVKHVTRR